MHSPIVALSLLVQLKTGAEGRQRTGLDVRQTGVGRWSISLENVTELDNGWLLCRWEWGHAPAVALTSLAVRTPPVRRKSQDGRFGLSIGC